MLDLAELQEDLEGVDHRPPAVLSAVVCQDMLDRQPLDLVEGQHTVIQNIDGILWQLRGVELPKGKGTVGIDDGRHVNPADSFQGAYQERILREQVARVEALDLVFPEAGIGLLEEPDLFRGELDVLAVLLFLEAQEPFVLGLHVLLEPEVAHRAGADRDTFQPELIGEPQGPQAGCCSDDEMIFSRTSGGVSLGKLLGIGNRSMSPSRPRSWKARLYS